MFFTVTMNPCVDIAAATDRVMPERKLRCDQLRHDPGGGFLAAFLHRLAKAAVSTTPCGTVWRQAQPR